MCVLVTQLYLTLCDPMDCSLPASSIHGHFQARILEWIAISSPGIFQTQGLNPGLLHCHLSRHTHARIFQTCAVHLGFSP